MSLWNTPKSAALGKSALSKRPGRPAGGESARAETQRGARPAVAGPAGGTADGAAPGGFDPAVGFEEAGLRKALAAAEALRNLVFKLTRLPSLPALYTQVMAELAKPEASIHFIGRLISKDPAMTARILQMVNSTVFGLGSPTSDPVEAVLQLGVERTKAVILLADVFLHFAKSGCPGFSHDQLWRHSLAVGGFARAITLAQTKDMKLAEMAYTAGLLHDLGMLFLAANLPESYSQVLEQAERRNIPVCDVESEVYEASHAELAASVLGTWGLPDAIMAAIAWHHCPRKSGDKRFSLLTAVHVANAVEHEKRLRQAGKLASQIDFEYIDDLGLLDCRTGWRQICGLSVPVLDDLKKERLRLRQEVKE